MTPRYQNRRLLTFSICAIIVVAGAYLVLGALKENTQFFHSPSGLMSEGFVPQSTEIRVGGLVVMGTVEKGSQLKVEFIIRDFENPNGLFDYLPVVYSGILPDLFREGEGVVLIGAMNSKQQFMATEILAKHDNNYVPKLPEAGT